MTDYFVKYTGSPVPDSGLTSQVVPNTTNASGQDHSMQNTVQKRVAVTCICDGAVLSPVDILVQPKIGASYGADANAYHRLILPTIANQTVYHEYVLMASDTPKDFRFNVNNTSGGSVTISVETQDAVASDTP